ncbi:hypothetical protein GCM10022237_34460 [Nocardioides ginsengisoli]|uniref:Type IV toxin-antitoxin system AbiEi family antitoxin domain-containing protein n=1 Tax=Nocardioides ginsengisoli TaxID=363868 RepID=A0ABW3VWV4_9ACTN
MNEIADLIDRQAGVIARRQVLACGQSPVEVARMLRRHVWVQVHPGVYVGHTGPLTWQQRAWAAVLACWPAALGGWSAVRAHEGPGRRHHDDADPIEVVVRHGRHPAPLTGVVVRSTRRFDEAVQLQLGPPRQRYDDAVVELADRAGDDLRAIGILADACGGRRTTAARLADRVEQMSRLRRREWLTSVLADVAEGTCSVLEHGYLTRVERPHGLPPGLRQVADVGADGRRTFRDVVHGGSRPRWRQVVELDGRLFHDSTAARDRDLERDLDTALGGVDTVRLGYGQVLGRPCVTAAKLGELFRRRGWDGVALVCPECPG